MKPPIFDPTPELAADLEWMLQSQQATREMLAEALAQEYYAPLYHLALSVLDDSQAAQWASDEILAQALLNTFRYRDQLGVRAWLYALAFEQLVKAQNRLERQRALKATLPGRKKAEDFGVSTPQNPLDADLWLSVDALDENTRLVILLTYALGWNAGQIGEALQESPEEVASMQGKARQLLLALLHRQSGATASYPPVDSNNLDDLLKRSLSARWPPPELAQDALEQALERILRKSWSGGLRRQTQVHMKEVVFTIFAVAAVVGALWLTNLVWPDSQAKPGEATSVIVTQLVYQEITATPPSMAAQDDPLQKKATPGGDFTGRFYLVRPGDTLIAIAAYFGVPVAELRALNRLADGDTLFPGKRLLIPGEIPPYTTQYATPVPPNLELDPLKTPYSSDAILSRMRLPGTLFNTVWLDTQIIDYGPLGYIGPVNALRVQAWIGVQQTLMLVGPIGGEIIEVRLRLGDKMYLARIAEDQPWFLEVEQWGAKSDSLNKFLEVLFRSIMDRPDLSAGYTFKGLRREKAANGRDTLVVDQTNEAGKRVAQLWLDDRTGLVLRKLQYGGEDYETLLQEVVVDKIAYDIDFPQELFTTELPWRGGFASGFDGKPEVRFKSPLPVRTNREAPSKIFPPEGFDPSHSRLTFQYVAKDGDLNANQMDLFADQYFIGETLFGEAWTTICQRSPDGSIVAYVSQPSKEVSWASRLHWFNLSLADYVRSPLQPAAVTQFAFAPDNQRLAFFGYEERFSLGSIYITDLADTRTEAILKLADAKSLVWSPDGKYLALIARYQEDSYNEHVVVIDVEQQSVSYSESIDFQSGILEDWPTAAWGVEFPVEMSKMEDCSAPPQ